MTWKSGRVGRAKATAVLALAISALGLNFSAQATVFPATVGGSGDRTEEVRCPNGTVLVGFSGRVGDWIDQISLICAEFHVPAFTLGRTIVLPPKGGPKGAPAEHYCDRDAAIRNVFVHLHGSDYVRRLEFSCSRPRDGSSAGNRVFGGSSKGVKGRLNGGQLFRCPGSEYATGMIINYGKHVNAIGLICSDLNTSASTTGFGNVGNAANAVGVGERIEAGMENNTDRPGWDYRRFELSVRNPEACQNTCKADGNRCRAWTYVRPAVHGAKPVCYLKTAQPDAKPSACCISGINKKIVRLGKIPPSSPGEVLGEGMENDTNRQGSDIHRMELQQASPGICQTRCERFGQCKAWTYVRPGVQAPKAVCYLKNAAPDPAPNKCCISGAKATSAGPDAPSEPVISPYEENTDRPGSDYERYMMDDANPCRAACVVDKRCQAWTFVRAGIQGPTGICYLKRPAPAPVPNACCVSGTVTR